MDGIIGGDFKQETSTNRALQTKQETTEPNRAQNLKPKQERTNKEKKTRLWL